MRMRRRPTMAQRQRRAPQPQRMEQQERRQSSQRARRRTARSCPTPADGAVVAAPPPPMDEWLRIAAALPLGAEGKAARDDIFAKVDVDGDGTMTEVEAQNGLQVLLSVDAALWVKALAPVVAEGFKVCSDVEAVAAAAPPPAEEAKAEDEGAAATEEEKPKAEEGARRRPPPTPAGRRRRRRRRRQAAPAAVVPAEAASVSTGHPGGGSREAVWKLCVYLRRHCELVSALGRAASVDEYDPASSVGDAEYTDVVAALAAGWGVAPPDFLSLDADGDGSVSVAELSAWACGACVREAMEGATEETMPEEPIVAADGADAAAAEGGDARRAAAAGGGGRGAAAAEGGADGTAAAAAAEADEGAPEVDELPEELRALSGHVEGLVMPGNTSKNVEMSTPGLDKDDVRELRKTKVGEVSAMRRPGDLTDSLVEATVNDAGRGLNTDGIKRSKIQPIRKQQELQLPELPALRVAPAASGGAPASPSKEELDALRMDPDRKALAAQFGFGEVVPVPTLPSHAPVGWTPMPVRSERQSLTERPPRGRRRPSTSAAAAGPAGGRYGRPRYPRRRPRRRPPRWAAAAAATAPVARARSGAWRSRAVATVW